MSFNRRLAHAVCAAIGAQALAFAAVAQTPETDAVQRPVPSDATQTTTQAEIPTTRESRAESGSTASSTARDWDQQGGATQQQDATRNSNTTRTATADDHQGHAKDKSKTDPSTMKPVTAQSFASQAAMMGKAEVELAQVALKNSKDEEVREYAQRMVKDHTAANAKLKDIAAKQNLQLPQSLDAKHQQTKQQLSNLQGEQFDKAYKQQMNKSHKEAVALFESASQTQQMPQPLKEFAASTLSTLEQHKDMAETLEAREGA